MKIYLLMLLITIIVSFAHLAEQSEETEPDGV
jgi:hypothetical protein